MLEGKMLAFINEYDVQNYFATPFSIYLHVTP